MAYVFGAGYGDLYGNVLGTQQADANNWFRLNALSRQDQSDQFNRQLALQQAQEAAAQRAQETARWNFSRQQQMAQLGLEQSRENRAQEEWRWRQDQPTAAVERGQELLFKNALELADTGELSEDVLGKLPETQKTFLSAHNERARKVLAGEKDDLQQAADLLNRQTELEHKLKLKETAPAWWRTDPFAAQQRAKLKAQGVQVGPAAVPPVVASLFSPEESEAWQEELTKLQRQTAKYDDMKKSGHLRLDPMTGRWVPNLRLPWAVPASSAMAGVARPAASLTPGGVQTGGVLVRRKADGVQFRYKGDPSDVPTDQFDLVE